MNSQSILMVISIYQFVLIITSNYRKAGVIGCKCESLNGLLQIDFNLFMMMTGSLLAWIQILAVQHFTFEVLNIFTKATTFTPVFPLLLVI